MVMGTAEEGGEEGSMTGADTPCRGVPGADGEGAGRPGEAAEGGREEEWGAEPGGTGHCSIHRAPLPTAEPSG